MVRKAAKGNTIKVLIIFAFLEISLGDLPKSRKTIESEYPRRNFNAWKPTSQKPYLETYREPKEHFNISDQEIFRKNGDGKADLYRKMTQKWPRRENAKETDYFRKVNRDALIGKVGIKVPRKEEIFESSNTKLHRSNEHHPQYGEERHTATNVPRDGNSYVSQKHFNMGDREDYLASNRQRKIKKQGANSFIPFPVQREQKPNIILILTDDQDVELGSLNFMPKTLRLLRDGGAEFRHAYVTTPMCCPSRSSLLTGMYVHNHNVFTNNENCSNLHWQQTHETKTFATYLSNAGYRTGYFGKYLNKYNGSYIPPGWREWGGLIMNSRYYNYSINLNGKKIKHGFDYSKDYYPDLIANDSITFLRQSKQYFSRKPVMLVVSFPAPHGPEDSAPQYSKMFFNVTTHHTPSYDFAPNPDKQWILQVTNKMQDIHKQFTDILMTKRLQTLQSVDSAVERIYQELKNIGELENTYIIYTSDHGYHLGQFGLVKGKSFPFEFDVRVPFLVRGPGVEAGTIVDDIVLNIDLAPTFLDLAGVESPIHMDGRSITPLFHHRSNKRRKMKWPDTFLIESSGRRETPESLLAKKLKVDRPKDTSTKWFKEGEVESETPGEVIQNFSRRPFMNRNQQQIREDSSEGESTGEENSDEESVLKHSYIDSSLFSNLNTQVDNKIPQIAQTNSQSASKLERIALECQKPEFQLPCQSGQKWYCLADGSRWRKYKCKFQRKCTCFTPNGFVYTGVYNEEREGGQKNNFIKKRSNEIDLWSTVSEKINFPTLLSIMDRSSRIVKRRRRETSRDHISDVLDDLELELYEAEETKSSINATFIFGQEPNASKCLVSPEGKVNCSSLLYNDFKIWKQSRDEIDAKIRTLKAELDALKEIRKHLREKRPESDLTTAQPTSPKFNFIEVTKNDSFSMQGSTTETVISTFEPELDTTLRISSTEKFPETIATTYKSNEINLTTSMEELIPVKPTNNLTDQTNNTLKFKNENNLSNKINGVITVNRGRDRCICRPDNQDALSKKVEIDIARENKKKLKEEKLRKKERKLKKKARLENECLSKRMNCFVHDNEHWRTPPLWTGGPFCFCMNANNNTYSCLRTINATHNYLYCEFTTGFKTFYNLRIDPFEQLNRISTLTIDESRYLSNQLADMKACKGAKECTVGNGRDNYEYNHHHLHHHHHHQHQHQSHLLSQQPYQPYNPPIKSTLGY